MAIPTHTVLDKEESYALANLLAQASSQILELRIRQHDKLTLQQRIDLEGYEDQLDHVASLLRAYGIVLIAEGAEAAMQGVSGAIEHARQTIMRIDHIKQAISAAAALVGLGTALLARDPQGILDAVQGLHAIQAADQAAPAP
ncbi:hypothetical protein [Janthinobacterium agaricidamnosum]|uniref:Uncharacterized protein n=1 Tax=Janthinobacterium agaricidamnosum NBRC 102515 = DSM 9628 TaxID=1349767 RepID=W0V1V2_9BURK|nr:hypothetical protein [Janthinobacterium agaricidamnosum]CDG82804.1 hypothetical protein GJA_2169 [Janthinobacterium agaricidamnosum NBRC 102515 = DSM 9628]